MSLKSMPFYSPRHSVRGLGLMQSVAAMGIGLVVVVGSMMMMKMTRDANVSIRAKADFDSLMTQVARVIETKEACETVFGGLILPNAGDADFDSANPAGTADGEAIPITAIGGLVVEGGVYGSEWRDDPGNPPKLVPSFRVTDINLWSDAKQDSFRKKQATNQRSRFHYLRLQVLAQALNQGDGDATGLGMGGGARMKSAEMRFIVQVGDSSNNILTSCHCRAWSDCPRMAAGAVGGFIP